MIIVTFLYVLCTDHIKWTQNVEVSYFHLRNYLMDFDSVWYCGSVLKIIGLI
jgi:hypothetical protein